MRIPDGGGVEEPLTTTEVGEVHTHPHFLPGDQSLLFTVVSGDEPARIAALSFDSGAHRILLEGSAASYAASGHLVFLREGALWAAGFSPDRLEVIGEAFPVLEAVRTTTTSTNAVFGLSTEGSLVYVPAGSRRAAGRRPPARRAPSPRAAPARVADAATTRRCSAAGPGALRRRRRSPGAPRDRRGSGRWVRL